VDADRPRAIARMARSLAGLEVTGLQTTLPFDRWLMADPAFQAGEVSTDFVDRRWQPDAIRAKAAATAAAAVAAAFEADARSRAAERPRHHSRYGWRETARREAVDRWPR